MSKARDLADFISTGSILSDGTIESTEISGVTATAAELNTLDGITASTAEINKLTGLTVSTSELNNVSGINTSVQSQLDAKANTSSLSSVALSGSYNDLTNTPTGVSVATLMKYGSV